MASRQTSVLRQILSRKVCALRKLQLVSKMLWNKLQDTRYGMSVTFPRSSTTASCIGPCTYLLNSSRQSSWVARPVTERKARRAETVSDESISSSRLKGFWLCGGGKPGATHDIGKGLCATVSYASNKETPLAKYSGFIEHMLQNS